MTKDKKWLMAEVYKMLPSHAETYNHPDDITVLKTELLNEVVKKIIQLDEPKQTDMDVGLLKHNGEHLNRTKVQTYHVQEKLDEYREALEFYGDRENYALKHFDPNLDDYMSTVDYDEGARARKTLEEPEE